MKQIVLHSFYPKPSIHSVELKFLYTVSRKNKIPSSAKKKYQLSVTNSVGF